MVFKHIKERYKRFFDKYPMYGRKLRKHPKSVAIWISIVFITSLVGLILSELSFMSKPAPLINVLFFVSFSMLFKFYFNRVTYKEGEVVLLDLTTFFVLISALVFQNVFVMVIVSISNAFISYLFGVRRMHAVIFNFSVQINSALLALVLIQFFQTPFIQFSIELILLSLLISINTNLLSSFQMMMIMKFSLEKPFTTILGKLNWGEEVFSIFIGFFGVILVLINTDLYILSFLSILVIFREKIHTLHAKKKNEYIVRDLLDKIGNPLTVIDGFLQKILRNLETDKYEKETIQEDINTALDQLKMIDNSIRMKE